MLQHRVTSAGSRRYGRCLLAATLLCARPVAAETLLCHVSYGGETQILHAEPVASPYAVPVQAIGSYFLFRMVWQKEPADLAAIKLYVLAASDGGAVPIQQLTHLYPPPALSRPEYGFTGLNSVYEPVRDGELQYWCELSAVAGRAP
ncbi:MAG: hypothetical protein FAZ92_02484 [Accumulibacter sp.]|uniref:hypothetical protein n=1 Tax=Accumulibacter sp. TaxID=2053492 RepID=UPI001218B0AA|nr:hypothetical protein [Accumulibacter sp.]TLD45234.1 MAG: hypothetical protein FAZ92_02484 [Accumulibacter sp.]